jgi:DDE superfamily endonuclease
MRVHNSNSSGSWLMTIVTDILKQMPAVRQPQRKFLAVLFTTILALRGRVTGRNLSRYCTYAERTIARQFRASFAWPDFHQRVIKVALEPGGELISAQDASFIPKSGKQTFGLGHFFNGSASRTERGLEISTLAVVDVTRRCAFTLAVAQTPPSVGNATSAQAKDETRMDFYKQQLHDQRQRLPQTVIYHCVATLRKRNIWTRSWPSTCTRSRNCVTTPTVCFSIPGHIPSVADHGVSMTGRSLFRICVALWLWGR